MKDFRSYVLMLTPFRLLNLFSRGMRDVLEFSRRVSRKLQLFVPFGTFFTLYGKNVLSFSDQSVKYMSLTRQMV